MFYTNIPNINFCNISNKKTIIFLSFNMEVFELTNFSPELIPDGSLEKMAETLKAVAHPIRLQIVNILMNGERSVGDLVRRLGTKQSLTSQQLSILKSRGVLRSRRNGNVVFYSLENSGIKNIMTSILTETNQ